MVPYPSYTTPIANKWVYRTKLLAYGNLNKYKPRVVANGYSQLEGIDYAGTFSPIVKPQTIRVVLTLTISMNWSLKQLNANNAFLNSDL